MELAIQKAKKSGIGWVVAKGSNNFGIATWYGIRALEHNMVGLVFTNTSPLMAPTRAKTAALGSNPICMAAPALKGDSFILDMSTTAASLGKLEMHIMKGEPIPEGWAIDSNGKTTTDPLVAMNGGALLPLGGNEVTSGYKGYGLALMVETLCGILGGANYGPYIKRYGSDDARPANLGQCFVAINPECFAPGFQDRLSNLLNALRKMEPADPKKPVIVPGDPERNFMRQVEKQGGIRYHQNLLKVLDDIASKYNVKPLTLIQYGGPSCPNMARVPEMLRGRSWSFRSRTQKKSSQHGSRARERGPQVHGRRLGGRRNFAQIRLPASRCPDMYVSDIKAKTMDPNAEPSILKETPATAWVDGKNGLGPVIGNFCMDLAIKKAKTVASNHFGIAGWYTRTAQEQGLLGMSFTNTSPLMSPTRATRAALGTNPISLAAPAKNGDSFVLDMATAAVAVGKIEVQRKKGEPIPEGWAQGPDGKITTDADVAFKTKCLMPLGGAEVTSGYKGYGLGLLVETFCGVLAGSTSGPNVRKWMEDTDRPADLGQTFVAIDPNCFAPGFEDRMSNLNDHLRGMERSDPTKPVLVPGDPERIHIKAVDEQGVHEMVATREEVSRFIIRALGAVDAREDLALQLAEVLVDADYKGHYSHGLNRIEFYIEDIRKGWCNPNAEPTLLKESPATAWVDGNDAFGSNHYGIAGWYSRLALKHGLLGMSFTNGSPKVTPTRAKKAALSTNPLTLAAPASGGDSFVLDMATSVVALGKVEVQMRKHEPIPEGWAQDPEGRITTDAELAFKSGSLLPLGGSEVNSGYKGYGLSMMVETFASLLSGSAIGPHIRHWGIANGDTPPNLGHCFVAIDPQCFAPGFEDRMGELMNYMRNMEPHHTFNFGRNKTLVLKKGIQRQNFMFLCTAMLINDIKCGAICPTACPTLEKEGCSTGVVCGANGLGPVICNFAMKIAIAKAKGSGISIVTANRSNYCGLMSFYTDQALQCGLIIIQNNKLLFLQESIII
ncbi:hypothetical protein C0J52_13746 [Blattella germanica]|nr:hypothetical protein C0J52_13746 [Blattella germanica]